MLFRSWTALAITLPLIGDAIYTLCCRLLRRENIFQAHRSHIFQRLQQAGWTHARVAIAYISLNCFIALSIAYLGTTGAWLSLGTTILAILVSEIYLKYRVKTMKLMLPPKVVSTQNDSKIFK